MEAVGSLSSLLGGKIEVSTRPLAGWYPDPSGAARQRYWDGQRWTGHAPQPQSLSRTALWIALTIIAVVAVFFAGCSALVAAGSQSHKTSGSGSHGGPTAAPGTPVVDGDFEFVVSDVSTPANWRGDPKPRGQWIIATVTVRNTDDDRQSFMPNNQKLIDSAGRVYMGDATAAVRMNNDSMVIDMKPGFKITMKVPFDVPTGTLPAAIELHDSVFTDGARVQLN
jgi:hypothetical protein